MVHTFKFGGQRIAYDSVSGLTLPLTELAYKMLDYIELPMAKECPTALRYDLAKFDSAAISTTYGELYDLYQKGELFAKGEAEEKRLGGGAVIAVGELLCTRDNPHVLDIAKALADEGKDTCIRIVPCADDVPAFGGEEIDALSKELEKLSREQIKRASGAAPGKPFEAFKKLQAKEHNDAVCAHCWAKKLCSLSSVQSMMCQLEKKRIECVMMCETAAKK